MNRNRTILLLLTLGALFAGAYTLAGRTGIAFKNGASTGTVVVEVPDPPRPDSLERATFSMGCFWHSEEIFLELRGVTDAIPGYCGGTEANPDYEMVGSGNTRYAESVNITFDPKVISYKKLLQVFFTEHDPTTLNRQGPDVGPQYRSVAFYRNADQKLQIDDYLASLVASHKYSEPIVTEVVAFRKFYRAEDYHLRFFRNNPNQPYIASVTLPEILKFRADFPNLLK